MAHAQKFDAIADGFLSPTLPKHMGKLGYWSIQDTHHLLTANAAWIEGPCGRGQNSHLGLVLTKTQYAIVSQVPLVRPTNPGCKPNIPSWTNPFDKKALLRELAKQRQQCGECCNVDAALCNHLLTEFQDTYLSPLKNAFTGYSEDTTRTFLSQMHAHYARILDMDQVNNDKKLQESYNPDNPLEIFYTRLNKCVDYATVMGEPII